MAAMLRVVCHGWGFPLCFLFLAARSLFGAFCVCQTRWAPAALLLCRLPKPFSAWRLCTRWARPVWLLERT